MLFRSGGNQGTGGIGDADDIAHLVSQVEVLGSIVEEPGRVAGVVILEIHGVRPVGLRQDDAIFCCEVGGHSIDGFAGPDATFIISITINVCCAVRVGRVHSDLRKHPSIRPLELHVAIGENITVGIAPLYDRLFNTFRRPTPQQLSHPASEDFPPLAALNNTGHFVFTDTRDVSFRI